MSSGRPTTRSTVNPELANLLSNIEQKWNESISDELQSNIENLERTLMQRLTNNVSQQLSQFQSNVNSALNLSIDCTLNSNSNSESNDISSSSASSSSVNNNNDRKRSNIQNSLKTMIQSYVSEFKAETTKFKRKVTISEKENKRLHDRIGDRDETIANLKECLKEVTKQRKSEVDKISRSRDEFESMLSTRDITIENLNRNITHMQDKLQEQQTQIESYQKQQLALQKHFDQFVQSSSKVLNAPQPSVQPSGQLTNDMQSPIQPNGGSLSAPSSSNISVPLYNALSAVNAIPNATLVGVNTSGGIIGTQGTQQSPDVYPTPPHGPTPHNTSIIQDNTLNGSLLPHSFTVSDVSTGISGNVSPIPPMPPLQQTVSDSIDTNTQQTNTQWNSTDSANSGHSDSTTAPLSTPNNLNNNVNNVNTSNQVHLSSIDSKPSQNLFSAIPAPVSLRNSPMLISPPPPMLNYMSKPSPQPPLPPPSVILAQTSSISPMKPIQLLSFMPHPPLPLSIENRTMMKANGIDTFEEMKEISAAEHEERHRKKLRPVMEAPQLIIEEASDTDNEEYKEKSPMVMQVDVRTPTNKASSVDKKPRKHSSRSSTGSSNSTNSKKRRRSMRRAKSVRNSSVGLEIDAVTSKSTSTSKKSENNSSSMDISDSSTRSQGTKRKLRLKLRSSNRKSSPTSGIYSYGTMSNRKACPTAMPDAIEMLTQSDSDIPVPPPKRRRKGGRQPSSVKPEYRPLSLKDKKSIVARKVHFEDWCNTEGCRQNIVQFCDNDDNWKPAFEDIPIPKSDVEWLGTEFGKEDIANCQNFASICENSQLKRLFPNNKKNKILVIPWGDELQSIDFYPVWYNQADISRGAVHHGSTLLQIIIDYLKASLNIPVEASRYFDFEMGEMASDSSSTSSSETQTVDADQDPHKIWRGAVKNFKKVSGIQKVTRHTSPSKRNSFDWEKDQFDVEKIRDRVESIWNSFTRSQRSQYCAVIVVTLYDLSAIDCEWLISTVLSTESLKLGFCSLARFVPSDHLHTAERAVNYLNTDDKFDRSQFLRNVFHLLTYTTMLTFQIRRCVAFHCCLNGFNTLDEFESQPLHLCPICLRKLHVVATLCRREFTGVGCPRHTCHCNLSDRYENLKHLYRTWGLENEAKWIQERLSPK